MPTFNRTRTNKAIDPNKRHSSTLSKLQGLSASGIGTVHHLTSDLAAQAEIIEPILEPTSEPALSENAAPLIATPIREIPPQPQTLVHQNLSAGTEESFPQVTAQAANVGMPLFKGSVDTDMDTVFAKIAPPEAQREVQHPTDNVIPQAPAANAGKLFQGSVDAQVDQLFSGIAPSSASPSPAITPAIPPQQIAQPRTPAGAEAPKLFKGSVDDQVEGLFSDLASPEAQKEFGAMPAAQSAGNVADQDADYFAQQKAIAHELKDFGRLSVKSSANIEASVPSGTMKTIGKFLIDTDDVDNIIKKADAGEIVANLPSARVISAVRGEGIQALLESIDNYRGVSGSMLVGSDGLVIASTYTGGGDRDSTGVLAHGLFGNTNLAMLRLDLGKLQQMVFVSKRSENGGDKKLTTILTDVEVGALSVFVDTDLAVGIEQLMEQINTIVHG